LDYAACNSPSATRSQLRGRDFWAGKVDVIQLQEAGIFTGLPNHASAATQE